MHNIDNINNVILFIKHHYTYDQALKAARQILSSSNDIEDTEIGVPE